ncbi:hypothetical protein GL325_00335 [Aeromicrobium sp. 636]|uniref:Uncharacterized protein n=1 Tax=Aeromicrobium senzhongii TaxID=2663859 RepID=A0A8I0K1M7_9ACTN|nr:MULTISPECIES: hypothetical protein [Aeromicrobium]MBC9224755.1 hypothetical protein [Aeromicrobium senzhongii]MCQ3996868.1 hypothetical protein [Aeromicrobium sp. 636]MTB86801.1 hypothetical protein [Aeromicrobium senzhongii]QNL93358.1 hypothetical protein H9L21_09475 [Aeromicrobium senzhongii]
MSSRRVVLAAAGGVAVALAGLFVTDTFDDALRAVGAKPKPLPRPEDTSLMKAVVDDQQRVLAIARGADNTAVATLLAAQLEQLGATPGTTTTAGDLAGALRTASRHRATDARTAISPEFAQVLASLSAGLAQAVTLA